MENQAQSSAGGVLGVLQALAGATALLQPVRCHNFDTCFQPPHWYFRNKASLEKALDQQELGAVLAVETGLSSKDKRAGRHARWAVFPVRNQTKILDPQAHAFKPNGRPDWVDDNNGALYRWEVVGAVKQGDADPLVKDLVAALIALSKAGVQELRGCAFLNSLRKGCVVAMPEADAIAAAVSQVEAMPVAAQGSDNDVPSAGQHFDIPFIPGLPVILAPGDAAAEQAVVHWALQLAAEAQQRTAAEQQRADSLELRLAASCAELEQLRGQISALTGKRDLRELRFRAWLLEQVMSRPAQKRTHFEVLPPGMANDKRAADVMLTSGDLKPAEQHMQGSWEVKLASNYAHGLGQILVYASVDAWRALPKHLVLFSERSGGMSAEDVADVQRALGWLRVQNVEVQLHVFKQQDEDWVRQDLQVPGARRLKMAGTSHDGAANAQVRAAATFGATVMAVGEADPKKRQASPDSAHTRPLKRAAGLNSGTGRCSSDSGSGSGNMEMRAAGVEHANNGCSSCASGDVAALQAGCAHCERARQADLPGGADALDQLRCGSLQ